MTDTGGAVHGAPVINLSRDITGWNFLAPGVFPELRGVIKAAPVWSLAGAFVTGMLEVTPPAPSAPT